MIVFGQSGCIRLKWFYFWKVVVNRQRDCIGAKLVIFVKSGCIRTKVVVFGQSGCIREKWFYSDKSG